MGQGVLLQKRLHVIPGDREHGADHISADRCNGPQAFQPCAANQAHEHRLGIVIGGMGGGNLSGKTPQKRVPGIPGRRFQALFPGNNPAGAQVQRNTVAPAEIRHKGLVPVRFGTAQMVIEVGGLQGNPQLIPQQIQRKQHCHGIRAAGDSSNYLVSRGKKCLLFQKGAQFIQHASTPGP